MRKIKIVFAGREIEFVDRDIALKQIEEFAERGTYPVYVIYGPEGCGKTTFFKQAKAILEDYGYSVVHINPLAESIGERFSISEELKELARELGAYILKDASSLIEKAVELLYTAVRRGIRRRIAILADDVFQAIGLDKAEQIVKSFLNMIEWPSIRYEKIVVLVASSEGITMERVGRHDWSFMYTLWNMSRDGFKQLYEVLPDPKLPFDDVWRITGGNPRILEILVKNGWNVDIVINNIVVGKRLVDVIDNMNDYEKDILRKAIEDPDALRGKEAVSIKKILIEKNLIIYIPVYRESYLWIDVPPPEKDLELGIGRHYAWQTPLHREAVRRALEN
ncbi:ATPase [Ignisphaera aggregans DSM 17230]|uniref:ATPase n=1 Tax=Ignisphaera aggregans (strain DSM 17230 / JCM 13409 / AQ1.S1) TaxID=583356 RepID=E0SRW3_IGNAA|nr:ATPase [Ignisphaera aggregans DSM 17230]